MHTSKLVVGQDVHMHSGIYAQKGKVVEVTPSGVRVETTDELLGFIATAERARVRFSLGNQKAFSVPTKVARGNW